jgi:hypothetical protein
VSAQTLGLIPRTVLLPLSTKVKVLAYLAVTGALALAPIVIWRQYNDNHGLTLALAVSVAVSAWIYRVQLHPRALFVLVAAGLAAANWVAIEGLALLLSWSVFGFGP